MLPQSDVSLPAIWSPGTLTLLPVPRTAPTGPALEATFLMKGPGQTGLEPGQATLLSQGLTPCSTIPPLLLASSVHH